MGVCVCVCISNIYKASLPNYLHLVPVGKHATQVYEFRAIKMFYNE